MRQYRTVERVSSVRRHVGEIVEDAWYDTGVFFKGVADRIGEARLNHQRNRLCELGKMVKKEYPDLDSNEEIIFDLPEGGKVTFQSTELGDDWEQERLTSEGKIRTTFAETDHGLYCFRHTFDAEGQEIDRILVSPSSGYRDISRTEVRHEIHLLADRLEALAKSQ